MNSLELIASSWINRDGGRCTTEQILDWIAERNRTVAVDIRKNKLSDSTFWLYDQENGTIHNQNNSFFSISGLEICG